MTARFRVEYLMEAGLLGIFMLLACAFVVLLDYPSSPVRLAIPDAGLRRLLTGLAMGTTAVSLIYSPWGMQSGAHFNPATTLTFYRLGKVRRRDAVGYVAAQFAGAVAGVGVAWALLGRRLADPATHFKLGRGGLSDIEWTVQALQMSHAGRIPELRTTKTLTALDVAVEEGLLEAADAEALRTAWLSASRLRNATVQVRGKPSDALPHDARERAAVAAVLQYAPGETDAMVNDYLRHSRLARTVVDRLFWGD